ncbi:PaaI family thioesterase [Emcibacter sp. SYSU 3D8]|uniref:PaaI family thioesterase n=1 Tax=Emcibacter sp. SYSU 3D8 TaxID=3133969 RepID=UPI0031FE7162
MSDTLIEIPPGFTPLRFRSAYLGFLGPFYEALRDGQAIVGLPLEEKHMNLRAMAHGGVLATLADVTLSFTLVTADTSLQAVSTVSLTTDFLGTAKLGNWVEGSGTIDRMGGNLAFVHGKITSNGVPVATMSGVFKLYWPE